MGYTEDVATILATMDASIDTMNEQTDSGIRLLTNLKIPSKIDIPEPSTVEFLPTEKRHFYKIIRNGYFLGTVFVWEDRPYECQCEVIIGDIVLRSSIVHRSGLVDEVEHLLARVGVFVKFKKRTAYSMKSR